MSKDAILPQVRVAMELRRSAESALADGESLSEFVELSVRTEIHRRALRAEFLAQGRAAAEAFEQDGRAVDAGELMERLQRKLDDAAAARSKAAA